jgi:pimeloyl-ACP methyl ester carboxylesterase
MRRVLALFVLATALWAESYPSGPQVLTFWSTVDDSDQPYGIYIPRNFDAAKKYPLVVMLHGAYSNHRLDLRRVFGQGNLPRESDTVASRYFPALRDVDFIVVTPYSRGTMGYQGIAEKDVYDAINDVKRRFPIDDDRVYLTGLSMGGGGTLWLGLTRPDVWAALAPVCAAAPAGTEELAPNALNLPVHLFHGDQDDVVPVEVSREWQKRFLNLGVKAEYVEFPGVHYNSWDSAYKDGAIFDWLGKFRRTPHPDRVRFVSSAYKYDSAYWVKFDGLTPGTPASVDARFAGVNRLEITTNNLDGFSLQLAGHPKFSRSSPITVTIDGTSLKPKSRDTLSFAKHEQSWTAAPLAVSSSDKRAGAEGPVAAAIAARHVYVYGTAGSPSPGDLTARREMAQRAADWTGMAGRLAVAFPVKSDKQVDDADLESANLILFGTKKTNSIIARLAPNLPLELNASAADYGLLFIAPAGNHYVLINSGLPWWTGADQIKWPRYQFFYPPAGVLSHFGDYLLFRGSLDNIVAEGRFDPHWKLSPDAVSKMQSTSAVVIK